MEEIDFHELMPVQSTLEVDKLLVRSNQQKSSFKVKLITGQGMTRDIVRGYLLMNDIRHHFDGINEGAIIAYFNEGE